MYNYSIDSIYTAVNVEIGKGVAEFAANDLRKFTRAEFLEAIIRVAEKAYLKTKKATNIIEATDRLINEQIMVHLPVPVRFNATAFRERFVYNKPNEAVFGRHMEALAGPLLLL